MTFPTVVFGSGIITSTGNITFTQGAGISAGGYRLFIVPTTNVGSSGMDLGFTYINQFGIQKTTTITTAVAPFTTAGTHIQVVLEAGDSGIQQLINAIVIGGNAGNTINFESWNEGSGVLPKPVINTTTFDRTQPGEHLFDPLFETGINVKLIDTITTIPILWYSSPSINVPTPIGRSDIVNHIPDVIVDRSIVSRDIMNEKGDRMGYQPDPLNIRVFNGISIQDLRSWLESVVGQVTSGYVTNMNEEIIRNAFAMILMSPATMINPSGSTITASVNPSTGLYQAFLKSVIYDKRYVMVRVGLKSVTLEGAGTPSVIDATQTLQSPYNLQFACPTIDCDFTISRKV